jgi:chorismate mutase
VLGILTRASCEQERYSNGSIDCLVDQSNTPLSLFQEDSSVHWRVRAIRGATTVTENSVEAIREALHELLDELEARNHLDPDEMVSATFTATRDLDAVFPAQIARERLNWRNVPLLDVQQMHVEGSLPRCIRFLIHFNTPHPQAAIYHPYLRGAKNLRPDWTLAHSAVTASVGSSLNHTQAISQTHL